MTQVLHLSSRWDKLLISLFISIQFFFPWVAEFHLKCWDVSISPLQDYSFRCWFSNNSVITFSEGCFPSSFMAEVGISSPFLYSNDLSSIFSYGGMVMLLSSLIISNCEDRVLFFTYPFNRSVVFSFKFFHVIKFCFSFQPECCLKSFLPIMPFFQ